MTVLILVMLLATVPPSIDCIDPAEETLILFYPASPVCPDHIVEVL